MSGSFNLDPVHHLTAGAVGEPGQRTFYIQGRSGEQLISLLCEKQQVEALARHIEALLVRLGQTHPGPSGDEPEDLGLQEPIDPEFRVGSMALGFDADRNLVLLQCEELLPGDADDEEDEDEGEAEVSEEPEDPLIRELADTIAGDERATVRFWATRAQMRALAKHATSVVQAGRPICPFCRNPIDPAGHLCPASNGHRRDSDLG